MAVEKQVTASVNEDGQIVIEVTDTWGTTRTVMSRRDSKALAALVNAAQAEG